MLLVQKYGGSSVADSFRIKNIAKRILQTQKNGYSPIVILSAQGDFTDELIQKAYEITDNPNKRELDMLLATGEQQSVALMAMAIQSLGGNAISFNASQICILTTDTHTKAVIKEIDTTRIIQAMDLNNIILITGFQGINNQGDITTLGRGGSDTTACAIAAYLNANTCEIYTDVNGVYTADPRIVTTAKKHDKISYNEMIALASSGAQVLHTPCIEIAKKHNVKLLVASAFSYEKGTWVQDINNNKFAGLAIDRNTAYVSLVKITAVGKNIQEDIIYNALAGLGPMIESKTDISISILVDELYVEKAARALHDALI